MARWLRRDGWCSVRRAVYESLREAPVIDASSGTELEELVGQTIFQIVRPLDLAGLLWAFASFLEPQQVDELLLGLDAQLPEYREEMVANGALRNEEGRRDGRYPVPGKQSREHVELA